MTILTAREGYRRWAPNYETETAVSRLEDQLVAELRVPTAGLSLLDVGCGTARRLPNADALFAVGVDLCAEMLSAAHGDHLLAVADVRTLPVATGSFDVVWCRLMIGHVSDLGACYAELSRVCRGGGSVIVTDVCAAAIDAGHRRTFRDTDGETWEIEHYIHNFDRHETAALASGLVIETAREGTVGPGIRDFYESAGRLAAYEEQHGLPLVMAMHLRTPAT